jgi:hypothetical protein
MKNKYVNKVMKAIGIVLSFGILTGLLGEYIVSREVNGYIQLAATGLWFYVSMRLGKMLYKLI